MEKITFLARIDRVTLDYILHQSPGAIGIIASPFTYIIKYVSSRRIISFALPKDPA